MAGVRDNNIGQGHTRKLFVYCGALFLGQKRACWGNKTCSGEDQEIGGGYKMHRASEVPYKFWFPLCRNPRINPVLR